MNNIRVRAGVVIHIVFLLIFTIISLISGSFSFLIAGIIYSGLVFLLTLTRNRQQRFCFFQIVSFFLLFYSVATIFIHYIYIDDVSRDYFLGPDELKYYSQALGLSKYSYSKIWSLSFSQFKYSDSPLIAAWISTLQKMSGLNPFFGLLFQKLNISFFNCFIPGMIYLLCDSMGFSQRKSFKSALLYGFFSFTFFYSLGLLRDIHIAVIYLIGIYIAQFGTYRTSNYLFMAVLGILAYFLRVENGMFFLAIVGAWILRQGGQNKTVIWLFSALVLGIVVVKIGGVGNILNTLEDTQSVYGARTLSAYSSESSLGIKMMQLPFPINYLGMTILSQVIPFPFWSAFNYDSNTMQDGIFYFPYALAGLFWFNVWIRFILNRRLFFKFIRKNKYLFAISLLYIVLVASTEINARRLMAIYPVLFLGYVFVTSHEKAIPKKRQIFYNFGIYAVLLLIYFALKF